jgi:cell division protein ZipA
LTGHGNRKDAVNALNIGADAWFDKSDDLIIALHVVTEDEAGFAGHDVLKVLEELGLKYGKMNIFHHYGLGDSKVQQPVYSVANLVEPGTFDPYNMPDFTTPGLAVFMRLPGPFGGRVAFELMLNNTQQIAEMLDGYIEDETHMLLDQRMISRLRERIAYFEQRGTRLSLRVRVS